MKKVLKTILAGALVILAALTCIAAVQPTHGTSISSWADFIVSSPFAQNYVLDKPRLWIPMSGGFESTATGLVGMGAGTPTHTEVNTSEMGGLLLDADAESGSRLIPVPADIDLSKDIRLRALWSNSTAAITGSVQFVFTYELFIADTTAISVPNDAVDTQGADQADSVTANALQWSPWSTITGGTITTLTPGDDILGVKCAVDLTTAADATLYGFQLEYHRKFLGGDGSY